MKTNTIGIKSLMAFGGSALATGWVVARLWAADAVVPRVPVNPWQYQTFEYPADNAVKGLNELATAGWQIVSATKYLSASSAPVVFVTARMYNQPTLNRMPLAPPTAPATRISPDAAGSSASAPASAPPLSSGSYNTNAAPATTNR